MSKYTEAFIHWLEGFISAIPEDTRPDAEQWKAIKERCRSEASNALEA